MSDIKFSCDNSGNITPNHPYCADPEPGSGITLTMAVAGDDYTTELEPGQMYAITHSATAGKMMFASATGVTSVAANIEWIFHARFPYVFRMPIGKTTLYFESDESGAKAYLRKLKK